MVHVYREIGTISDLQKKSSINWVYINNLSDFKSRLENIEYKKQEIKKEWYKICESEIQEKKLMISNQKNIIQDKAWMAYKMLYWEESINFFVFLRILLKIYFTRKSYFQKKSLIQDIENNKEKTALERVKSQYLEIQIEERFLNENKNLYYWAIWEKKVEQELKKLPLDSVIINDYKKSKQSFWKAVAMKWWHEWIQSVQIDHIVINKKGIFLIETKNRSQSMINHNTFSPVHQAKRHRHAFYCKHKDIFEKVIWKNPNLYSIVAMNRYLWDTKERWIFVMNIPKIKYFISSRNSDSLNESQIEKIKSILLRESDD